MGCAAIAWPKGASVNPEMLDAVGLPSETDHTAKRLSGSVNDLMLAAVSIMDEMVLSALEKRTAEEFKNRRDEIFPQYMSALFAFAMLFSATVPKDVRESVIAQSLSELEADFRDSGAPVFGEELRNRGMFTVWTLRKIVELTDAVQEMAFQDEENAKKFVANAVYSRFHVDCLVRSIHNKKPIFPELVEPIADGLRSAVNAYALIRQVVDVGAVEPELPPVDWDAEDEAWLSDSMRDLARKSS